MLRGTRRLALIGAVTAVAVGSVGVQQAAADFFRAWSGTAGPFSWHSKRLSCGVAGETPSRLRAHTRWRESPANGYQRVTFRRQLRAEDSGAWTTVQRRRLSTKNTRLEGTEGILHWRQSFGVPADQAGRRSRHIVTFEWLRDRRGADRRVAVRSRTSNSCVVGG